MFLAAAGAVTVDAQQSPDAAPRAIPVNTGPNDIARFLAGMPVPENSPLAPLMRDPAWQAHASFFEEQFSKLNLRQLQKLQEWQPTYLPESLQPQPCRVLHVQRAGFFVSQTNSFRRRLC